MPTTTFGLSNRRRAADRAARLAVMGGGAAVILSILGILVFILVEVSPLLGGATVEETGRLPFSTPGTRVLSDEYQTRIASLGLDGVLRILDASDGRLLAEHAVGGPDGQQASFTSVQRTTGRPGFVAATPGGRVVLVPVVWDVRFEGDTRIVELAKPSPLTVLDAAGGSRIESYTATLTSAGSTAVAQQADGSMRYVRTVVETNAFTGETETTTSQTTWESPSRLERILIDATGSRVYGAATGGRLYWWDVAPGGPEAWGTASTEGPEILSLALLEGQTALASGLDNGQVVIWFLLREAQGSFRLRRIRTFEALASPVRHLAPSPRDRSFLALDDQGNLALCHSTNDRILQRGRISLAAPEDLVFAPRADGAFIAGQDALVHLAIDNPFPESGLKAWFGKVWYENHEEPAYIWESSSGDDAFEPKLSLVPLIFGTLKGTLFALFMAVPLAVLGAMFASQFMRPEITRRVKPVVEIMAALPSVVLGLVAGLWLAPRMEEVLTGVLLMSLIVPAAILIAAGIMTLTPRAFRGRFPQGFEVFPMVLVVAAATWIAIALSGPAEDLLFGGDVTAWIRNTLGLAYDQRNAIVVGLGMGFAVIPIIFTISEDAFSNVPKTLVSGSLALGANRWQTVTRVVLPAASPGIFSAVMIGFGRAVGETMIVLMATGNTPIMDWNPFNGFRTLSANIAVEIPEAPQGETLYRTLFLAALLLFIITFLTNTAADVVRSRLKRRHGVV